MLNSVPEMTASELKNVLDSSQPIVLVDVREPYEHDAGHIDGCLLIPLGQLPIQLHQLNPQNVTVIYCHSGVRSAAATNFLIEQGFKDVSNLVGGYIEWKKLG